MCIGNTRTFSCGFNGKDCLKMFEKYIVLKRKHAVRYPLYLCICFMWICLCANVQSQPLEKKADEVKLAETGVTAKSEDVEKARIRAEEVKANADKSIKEIESFISTLEGDAKTILFL